MRNRNYSELFDSIRKSYEVVPAGQRTDFTKKLDQLLRELVCRNVREDIAMDLSCRNVKSERHIGYGYTSSGKRRYRCSQCGRTYTADSRRNLLSNSKLRIGVWLDYCGCFVNMYPLGKCAKICGIPLSTSFFMRRHLLESCSEHFRPSGRKQEQGCR